MPFIKLFVVLLFSTAFIFSFSHFGAKAFEKNTIGSGKFSDGTAIGTLDVSGKTKEETQSLLEEKYIDWIKDSSMQLQYGEKSAPFDLNLFHLDAKQTMDSMKDGQKNSAFITVNLSQVKEQIDILFPQINSSDIDLDKLKDSLNSTASLFAAGSHSFDLYNNYLLADHIQKDAVINAVVIKMKNVPVDLQFIINQKPTIEIPEESTFSFLNFIKENKIDTTDSLNIIATGIYQAILPSNFTIAERDISSMLPDYAQLGYEAMVSQSKNADLVFLNPNKGKYTLEMQLENNLLKVTLKGEKLLYDYKVISKDEQKLKPKTIIQYSPLLLPGKTKIQTQGTEGQTIKMYREIYQGSELVRSELISEDYYPPVYQVEVDGLTGSQSAAAQTSGTEGNQTNTTTTNSSDLNSATSTSSEVKVQDSNDSDLWGKPNEQPK